VTTNHELQTEYSRTATQFAERYRMVLGPVRVGPHAYAPDMTKPEGPSTGGGVQSLQHLLLKPTDKGLPTLVIGHADVKAGTAELHTYARADALFRSRSEHGTTALDPADYGRFLETARSYFAACGMRVTISAPPLR
jgi:hypothetical protein